MSRIGRRAIVLPKGVSVNTQGQVLSVSGPKGKLTLDLSPKISIRNENSTLHVERATDERDARALHGLTRNLVANMVTGVTTGFEKRLEITGVGFKAEVAGGKLQMNLGYSHPIVYSIPQGIEIAVDKQTKLVVRGMSAQQVGQVAAEIRRFREPDIYKAKGVKYESEVIKTKAGKTGGK